jgi:hypothetical protein
MKTLKTLLFIMLGAASNTGCCDANRRKTVQVLKDKLNGTGKDMDDRRRQSSPGNGGVPLPAREVFLSRQWRWLRRLSAHSLPLRCDNNIHYIKHF